MILPEPIKQLGLYDVRVALHPEVAMQVTVNVARSEEEAERQARGEEIGVERDDEPALVEEDTLTEGGVSEETAVEEAPAE